MAKSESVFLNTLVRILSFLIGTNFIISQHLKIDLRGNNRTIDSCDF